MPPLNDDVCNPFGTYTDPINAFGRRNGSIGLYRDFEPVRMQCFDQGVVNLEQWLTTGRYDETM